MYIAWLYIIYVFAHKMVAIVKVVQLCLTLCNPVDYNPPGSHVCGIYWSG